jgi:6-pyruvoyltetrahydropterin/6-carboxytetrahydropterin synthase
MFRSTKTFNGYSTAFRQWKATSHCRLVHGYSLSFKVWFEGDLDERNWVQDFGEFKRNGIKQQLSDLFDHTTVVALDDPYLETFELMQEQGIIDLRVVDDVGCERFAEYVFNLMNNQIVVDTKGRVRVVQVECFEDGTNNSAIYVED